MNARYLIRLRAAVVGCLLILASRASAQNPTGVGVTLFAELSITGAVGTVYAIECADFFSATQEWRHVTYLRLPYSPYQWDDRTAPAAPQRFYRVVPTWVAPPNLTCAADKQVPCGTDWAFDSPAAVGHCGANSLQLDVVSTVTNASAPHCPRLFSVTRTWRATDTCAESSVCSQTVTVVDTEPPNLACGADKEVPCGMDWAFDLPVAVDRCDLNPALLDVVGTVTNAVAPLCPRLLSVTRTWRATDSCGNSAFCSQTVAIVDTEPPTLACAADKEVPCGTDWAFDPPTAVDTCNLNDVLLDVVSTVTNAADPRCPRLYSVTRTWQATDACAQSAVCSQTVTIVDNEPPALACAADKEVPSGTDWAFDLPTAVDRCDLNNVQLDVVSTATNTVVPRFPTLLNVTRTWRATDTCAQSSFCSQTVSIVVIQPLNMVSVSPGTFLMGSPNAEADRYGNEGPQTTVTLTRGFHIGKYEVTQAEYLAVMGKNPSAFNSDLSRPVEQVSWANATNYCARLTAQERAAGRIPAEFEYRLPTEAEWEYAARAGTTTRFSYGDDPDYSQLRKNGWYLDNSFSTTQPVGLKLPNAWGLFDLHGNVWEWCQDWYGATLPGGSASDPSGPATGSNRVLRGASWLNAASRCRLANRYSYAPNEGSQHLGFRVVLAARR